MKEWLLSVFTAVLIVSVIFIILPQGKLSKFVKPFVSMIVILIVLSPVINVDGNFGVDFDSESASVEIDTEFLNYIAKAKIDFYTENCIKTAQKNGINGSEILIEYNAAIDGAIIITGVSVNLKNAVISSESEHIVILQKLKRELSEYLGIDETGVKIYE